MMVEGRSPFGGRPQFLSGGSDAGQEALDLGPEALGLAGQLARGTQHLSGAVRLALHDVGDDDGDVVVAAGFVGEVDQVGDHLFAGAVQMGGDGSVGDQAAESVRADQQAVAGGMTVVGSLPGDWDRQKALDVASSFIQQNADLKAIYCANDTMALGALQAVINTNNVGKILVVGTDGDTEAVASVEKGELAATIAQDPGMIGAKSLEEMVNAVKNKITVDVNAEPKLIPIDSLVISKK